MKIEIEWLSEASDCEDCGTNYAEGAAVRFEDGTGFELTPFPHCFNGDTYSVSDVYQAILRHLGHTAEEL